MANPLKRCKIRAGKWNHFRIPYGLILTAISEYDCQKLYNFLAIGDRHKVKFEISPVG